ncbi:FecR domain-containing protein [Thalassospira sp. TSL5-1]|uniref:FecR family protein n=1 Tax=Thalassospira sp. TSL5-1 TaxID=1544451 RepID=UPI00093D7979|nr:FecR family protein [Thalassospira sp. TSL5-1]
MTRSIVPHAVTRLSGSLRPGPIIRGTLGLLAVGSILSSQPAFARGEQAGVSAAVRGEVELAEAKGIVGTQVESGQPIYLGDYITSSAGSGMQILLMDETVFTIGPNSEIAIDDFVYDPSNNQGHMTASITRGVVRVLTGKLAHNDPKTMKINLPVGSIGIRGTQFLVSIETPSPANRGSSGPVGPGGNWSSQTMQFAQNQLGGQTPTGPIVGVVNLGPGVDRNDSGSRPGAVELRSLNGVTQPLSSEGFGAFITGDTVTTPTRFPTELAGLDMSSLMTGPSPNNRSGNVDGNGGTGGNGNNTNNNSSNATSSGANSSGGGQPATLGPDTMSTANNQTGQTVAGTLDVAMTQTNVTTTSSTTSNETSQTNTDIHNDPDINNQGTSAEAATYDAMRGISSGFYSGSQSVEGVGLTYFSETNVDFSNRTISASFNNIVDSEAIGSMTNNATYSMDMFRYYDSESSGLVIFTTKDFQDISEGCMQIGCDGKVVFKTPTSVKVELSTDNVTTPVKGAYDLTKEGPGNIPPTGPGQ